MSTDEDAIVRLDREGGQVVWVGVQAHWASQLTVDALAAEVVRLFQSGSSPAGFQPTSVDPRGRTLTAADFRTLAALHGRYNELREEFLARLPEEPGVVTIDTERGAQVRWRDGVLEALWFEADWVTSTTAQVLSETLGSNTLEWPAPRAEVSQKWDSTYSN